MNHRAKGIKRQPSSASQMAESITHSFANSGGAQVRPGFSPVGRLLIATGYAAARLFPSDKNLLGNSRLADPVAFGGPGARWVPQAEVEAVLSQHATAMAVAAAAAAASERSVRTAELLEKLTVTSYAVTGVARTNVAGSAASVDCDVRALWSWVLRVMATGGPRKPHIGFARGPWLAIVKYRGGGQGKRARFMFLVRHRSADVLHCVGNAPRSLFPHIFITQKDILV